MRVLLLFISVICILGTSCSPETNQNVDKEEETTDTTTVSEPPREKRLSPKDSLEAQVGDAMIAVRYSSPRVNGRVIWGKLEPYDKVWRAGANEATTIETSKDLLVNGELLAAGKYSLFLIPREDDDWTFIFNKVWDQWGAYEYNEAEDALRIDAEPEIMEENQEELRYDLDEDMQLVFRWEKISLPLLLAVNE